MATCFDQHWSSSDHLSYKCYSIQLIYLVLIIEISFFTFQKIHAVVVVKIVILVEAKY